MPTLPAGAQRIGRTGLVSAAVAAVMIGSALTASAAVDPFPPQNTPTAPPGTYTEQVLAQNGDGGPAPYYRIVGLANLGNDVVLASFDGRPNGGDSPAPNSILQRRSTDGGKTWGAATYIAKGQPGSSGVQQYGFSDPSYVVDTTTGDVFNFHVFSKNQGFAGSVLGNDDTNVNVISAEVSVSHDGGLSWSTDPASQPNLPPVASTTPGAPPLITDVVKPVGSTVNGVPNVGGVIGMFASSGEGIQLRYGAHAGRLIQQFAGRIVQADGSVQIQAYSVFSDDDGASWQMGTPVGTGMDENKVVELSNGDVMLNSRDSSGGGYRKVAVSHDGGQTYSTPVADTQLPDPTNNASITRMYPDAAEGSADAKKLLFSNAGSKTSRSNGTIRFSCDDGVSWTSSRVFQPGSMSYSTLTPLGGGNFGLFYEGPNGKLIFASFDTAWLNASCAAVTASPATIANGATASASITVANRGTTDLPAGSITLNAPAGWTASTASVPAVPAGETTTVSVSLTAPSSAAATPAGKPLIVGVVLSAGSTSVVGQLALTVTGNGAASPVAGAQIYGQRNDAGRDLSAQPYQAGEAVPYEFHVYSTGNLTEAVVPTAGNFAPFLPPGAGNCRYLSLPVYSDYLCLTPKHTVTAAEVAQGYFIPDTTWTVSAPGAATATLHVVGSPVSLVNRQPALSAAGGSSSFTDADGNGKTSVGDTVRRAFTVANTGNVPLASLQASSDAGMPVSCDSSTLLPGASTECSIVDTLTLDNLHKDKTLPAVEASFSAANADLTATATAVAPAYRIKPGRI